MATTFFDWGEFKNYYFNTSRYAKKQQLASSFHSVWFDTCGASYSLGSYPAWGEVRNRFNAANKKKWKVKLQGMGYTAAGVDGLYKSLTNWLNANK